MFEVGEEDDFAPSPARRRSSGPSKRKPNRSRRGAPAARSPKRKGGKKRRKSSGPNWVLMGISIGGGVLVLGALIWLALSLFSTTHDSLAREELDQMNDLAAILEGIQDEASAKAAVPRIQSLGDRVVKSYEKQKKLHESNPLSDEERKALKEKYKDERDAANKRLREEMTRLQKDRAVAQILNEAMSDVSKKMAEARREEREKQAEERQKKHEEFLKKIEERKAAARAQAEQNRASGNP